MAKVAFGRRAGEQARRGGELKRRRPAGRLRRQFEVIGPRRAQNRKTAAASWRTDVHRRLHDGAAAWILRLAETCSEGVQRQASRGLGRGKLGADFVPEGLEGLIFVGKGA